LNASSRHFGFGSWHKELKHLSCHLGGMESL
jgi:hypothetical protein